MNLERMTLEQRIELIEKAVCTLIDSISPMNQEFTLTNRRIEQLEAICSELKNESKKNTGCLHEQNENSENVPYMPTL